MSVPLDILDSGPREPRPRRRRAVAGLVAVVLVVLAGAWLVDQRWRGEEFAALSGCARRADAAVAAATGPVETKAGYVRPSLAFAQESSADGLYAIVAEAAAGAEGVVRRAREACAAVEVRGRHRPQAAARAAWLAYLDAETGLLERTAGDGRAWFDASSDVPRLRRAAGSALKAAAPALPWLA